MTSVTILILVDGFLQLNYSSELNYQIQVTILILVDGFLQYCLKVAYSYTHNSHNPYFSRWFSAISSPQKTASIKW